MGLSRFDKLSTPSADHISGHASCWTLPSSAQLVGRSLAPSNNFSKRAFGTTTAAACSAATSRTRKASSRIDSVQPFCGPVTDVLSSTACGVGSLSRSLSNTQNKSLYTHYFGVKGNDYGYLRGLVTHFWLSLVADRFLSRLLRLACSSSERWQCLTCASVSGI